MKTRKQSFTEWMQRVDAAINKKVGLTHWDLADWCYHDAYDNGETPTRVAKEVLEAEGWHD
jgi:hypothetical protein